MIFECPKRALVKIEEQQEKFRIAYREEHGRFPAFCEHPFTDRLPQDAPSMSR